MRSILPNLAVITSTGKIAEMIRISEPEEVPRLDRFWALGGKTEMGLLPPKNIFGTGIFLFLGRDFIFFLIYWPW